MRMLTDVLAQAHADLAAERERADILSQEVAGLREDVRAAQKATQRAEDRAHEAGRLLGQCIVLATIDTRNGEAVDEPDHAAPQAVLQLVRDRDDALRRADAAEARGVELSEARVLADTEAQQLRRQVCDVTRRLYGQVAEHADSVERMLDLEASKDGAYAERNWLVAALSKLMPSHLARHPDEDTTWEDDWRWIVVIHGPAGQMTWHIHDSDRPLFEHLQSEPYVWDGHTTEEKYRRLAWLRAGREGWQQVMAIADLRAPVIERD